MGRVVKLSRPDDLTVQFLNGFRPVIWTDEVVVPAVRVLSATQHLLRTSEGWVWTVEPVLQVIFPAPHDALPNDGADKRVVDRPS